MVRGFGIVEVLLVVALAALLALLAVPGLRTLQANSATVVEEQRVLALLRLARSRATTARTDTVLCPLAAVAATPQCGDAFGGWLLFRDGNGDGRFRADADELLRLERTGARRSLQVLGRGGDPFSAAITYRADGTVRRPATLRLCVSGATRSRRLVVSMTGRVRRVRGEAACAA